MAIGVVRLTRKKRYILAIVVVCILLVQSVLGLIITGWSINIFVVISPNVYSEKAEVTFVFSVTGMYGTHVLLHNLAGIKICQKCYMKAEKKSTKRLLFIWTLAGCNTLCNIMIIAILAAKISKHIVRTLKHSMEKGMLNYLKDPLWKYTIDALQVKMACCGVNNYKDWHELTWIDKYHVNVDDSTVKNLRTSSERIHLPVTPWSCCRMDFPMQCFHDPLQQVESAYLWKEQPETVAESLYDRGCLGVLREPIEAALTGFIIIAIVILLVQIIVVMLLRILYTACRNAILLDDVDGVAPGWIFGRGDCGWNRGPDLVQLMEGYEQSYSAATSSGDRQSSKSSGKSFRFPPPFKLKKKRAATSEDTKSSGKSFRFPPPFKLKKKRAATSEGEPVSSGDEAALMLK